MALTVITIKMRKSREDMMLRNNARIFNYTSNNCDIFVLKQKNLKYSYFFSATDGQFKGVSDVFSHLMKTEGPKALYKGAAPVFVRAFVANSCCFMGYEVAMWGLNKAM